MGFIENFVGKFSDPVQDRRTDGLILKSPEEAVGVAPDRSPFPEADRDPGTRALLGLGQKPPRHHRVPLLKSEAVRDRLSLHDCCVTHLGGQGIALGEKQDSAALPSEQVQPPGRYAFANLRGFNSLPRRAVFGTTEGNLLGWVVA